MASQATNGLLSNLRIDDRKNFFASVTLAACIAQKIIDSCLKIALAWRRHDADLVSQDMESSSDSVLVHSNHVG
jgi:hypothetical protein